MDKSQALHDRASESLTLGVSTAFRRKVTPVPLYMERADGPYHYDVEGHYHGWMNNVLVSVHTTEEELGTTAPGTGGQPDTEFAAITAVPWNDLDALGKILDENKDEIACIITEPINVNYGSCLPDEGYLAGLLDLCKKHGRGRRHAAGPR